MDTKTIIAKDAKYIAGTYARNKIAVKEGKNATFKDYDGKTYIDFSSGIGVNSLGACDENWANAICEQVTKLTHVSNLFYTQPQVEVAEKLCNMSGMKKVFFGNSGAEANECAIKTARKYSFDKYGANRNKIITLNGSFHGRTITTLSATGQEHFHDFFFPFTEGFIYADIDDIEKIKELCDQSVCAIMLEGVQGEGGVMPLKRDFVRALCSFAKNRDILIIFDEVQTGIARTGKAFSFQHFDVAPDIITLAKGLGGGLPIGVTLFSQTCSDTLQAGSHGSTFGGNPIVCAAADVVLSKICEDGFLERVTKLGEKIKDAITACHSPKVSELRGLGLMIGIELTGINSKEVCSELMSEGLLTLTAGRNTLRILPPLTISDQELDRGLEILTNKLKNL